jgi:hypothetical protein
MKNVMELLVKSQYLAIIESQNLPFIMKWHMNGHDIIHQLFCVNRAFHFLFISTPKNSSTYVF